MCLILFAWRAHPRYPLVLAANRDEYLDRPTAAAAFWADAPAVLGGRDLDKGGSWFALDRGGRWAAVTNYREGPRARPAARSRGDLVRAYLAGSAAAADYTASLAAEAAAFPGFNLLVGDADSLYYLSNRGAGAVQVGPGIHGLSNHVLDTPWPKVSSGRRRVEQLMQAPSQQALVGGLFDILLDRERAQDHALPDTGIGLEWERTLSAPFIVSDGYGTRASTVVLIDRDGTALFEERSFGEGGRETGRQAFALSLRARTAPLAP